jgi:hypothetical protein
MKTLITAKTQLLNALINAVEKEAVLIRLENAYVLGIMSYLLNININTF